ncbi:MAG: hypothetical protein QOI98_2786 [Solirubrobacteraceae bacterium]|jgi:hypothetical protein|nr:hypothetical protein [Solirubrobacteraceae bacterium]
MPCEVAAAVLALVAAGVVVPADRACAEDVAVWKEAALTDRVDLLRDARLEESLGVEAAREVLRQRAVLR